MWKVVDTAEAMFEVDDYTNDFGAIPGAPRRRAKGGNDQQPARGPLLGSGRAAHR